MATFLVLRLQGPLMSFGDVAVDETRPTRPLPTQSQITGLLANALGWRAREGKRLGRLQERLVFGARQDRPGEVLVDYQNAHIHKGQAAWRARSDSPLVRAGGDSYDNLQRWRHYIADGAVSVALILEPASEEPTLEQVSIALMRPARPLFLGRAGCPPARFIHRGETVQAGSVPEALGLISAEAEDLENLYAEWPADGPLAGDGSLERQVIERADLRDWVDNLHTGWRLVAAGRITPESAPTREVA
jgi:CRISPR system Cascade subunit CasD